MILQQLEIFKKELGKLRILMTNELFSIKSSNNYFETLLKGTKIKEYIITFSLAEFEIARIQLKLSLLKSQMNHCIISIDNNLTADVPEFQNSITAIANDPKKMGCDIALSANVKDALKLHAQFGAFSNNLSYDMMVASELAYKIFSFDDYETKSSQRRDLLEKMNEISTQLIQVKQIDPFDIFSLKENFNLIGELR